MKHLGIEHPRRPRRRVCCKFGSVLYLLGSHWFSPFEDIDVQRKFFLPRWRICSEKSGDVWKNIDSELPVRWIKQSFMTERAFVNWWHPPEVQTESCFAEHLSQHLHYLCESDHGLNKTSAGAVQSYNIPYESYGLSICLSMWLKSSLHVSRVCHSHQTSWRDQFSRFMLGTPFWKDAFRINSGLAFTQCRGCQVRRSCLMQAFNWMM